MSLPCGAAPPRGVFLDAFELIAHQRESVGGGVCIGGPGEFGELTFLHLRTSVVAVLIAVLIAVPLGLWLGHIRKGEFLAVSVSNIGRAVPSLALLAFFVAFLGVGITNVTVVLTLLAIPPILTNTYVGTRQVDDETVAAARGVGLTEPQIVKSVELPLALPTIFAGIRTSAVAVVATATIAPLANVRSLGTPILEDQTYGEAGQIAAAIVVALITLAVDAGIGLAQRASTPKGLTVGGNATPQRRRFSLGIPARTES
ncbi:MAG: ABC transporter permease [Solirubrobacteraceae bacterium]